METDHGSERKRILPVNDRVELYKYFSFEGAKKTLEDGAIRLRKPTSFNDPFDMQSDALIPITSEDLADATINKIVVASQSGNFKGFFPASSIALPRADRRRKLKELKHMSTEEVVARLDKKNLVREYTKFLSNLNGNIKYALGQSYVFCMTEHESHLLMWAHYGDSHRGSVFKFRHSSSSKVSFIRYARQVFYKTDPPTIGDRTFWIEQLKKKGSDWRTPESATVEIMTTKSLDWSYEKEWRIIIPAPDLQEAAKREFGYYSFEPDELESIYLGYKMRHDQKVGIVEACKKRYSHVAIFDCMPKSGSFKVQFKRIY